MNIVGLFDLTFTSGEIMARWMVRSIKLWHEGFISQFPPMCVCVRV